MEPVTLLLVFVVPLVVFFVGVAFLLTRLLESPAVVEQSDEDPGTGEPSRRPWWGNPLVWLGIAGVFVLLGLFVAPGLFGGVFIFIPFMWIRIPRRRKPRPTSR